MTLVLGSRCHRLQGPRNFDRSLLDAYNVGVFASADIRLFRGFSFNIFGNYSLIRDQLALPLSGATEEEVLLQSRRLSTGYDYFVSVGFNYRFGSIFNNVVNPRFGGGGGGGRRIMISM